MLVASHTCLFVILVLLSSTVGEIVEQQVPFVSGAEACIGKLIDNSNQTVPLDHTTYQCSHTFPELCKHYKVVYNGIWMMQTSPGTCNITYTAVSSGEQQIMTLSTCYTIYECWLVHGNKSVCLYLQNLDAIQDKPSLTLVTLMVKEGKWEVQIRTRIFLHKVNTSLPFSTTLYGTTMDRVEIAHFFIGNKVVLFQVILYFDGTFSYHRKPRVCKPHHRIVGIAVNESSLVVLCDNEVVYVKLEQPRTNYNITPADLNGEVLNPSATVTYGEQFGAIVINNYTGSHDMKYCFVCQMGDCLNYCGIISNTLFVDGVVIKEEGSSNELFVAILNQSLAVLSTSQATPNIIAMNVCHSDLCYLYRNKHSLYIYEPGKTTVLDLTSHELLITQHTSVQDMILAVERAERYCNDRSTPVPTTVTQSLPTMSDIHTSFLTLPSHNGVTIKTSLMSTILPVGPSTDIMMTNTITPSISTPTIDTTTVVKPTATRDTATSIDNLVTATPTVNETSDSAKSPSRKEIFIVIGLVVVIIFLLSMIIIYCACIKSPAKTSLSTKVNWSSMRSLTSDSGTVNPVYIPHVQQATGTGYTNDLDEIVCQTDNKMVPTDYCQPASQRELQNTTRKQWRQNRTEPSQCTDIVSYNASKNTT